MEAWRTQYMEQLKKYIKDEEVVEYKTVGQFSGLGLAAPATPMTIWNTPLEVKTTDALKVFANLRGISRDHAVQLLTDAYNDYLEATHTLQAGRPLWAELYPPMPLNEWLELDEPSRDSLQAE